MFIYILIYMCIIYVYASIHHINASYPRGASLVQHRCAQPGWSENCSRLHAVASAAPCDHLPWRQRTRRCPSFWCTSESVQCTCQSRGFRVRQIKWCEAYTSHMLHIARTLYIVRLFFSIVTFYDLTQKKITEKKRKWMERTNGTEVWERNEHDTSHPADRPVLLFGAGRSREMNTRKLAGRSGEMNTENLAANIAYILTTHAYMQVSMASVADAAGPLSTMQHDLLWSWT